MDDFFKKIFSSNSSGNLFDFLKSDKKSDSSLGIDIGSAFIKIAEIKKKNGKGILNTYGEIALGPYAKMDFGSVTNLPPKEISQALLDLLKETNISVKNCFISIPSAASLIFTINLPSSVSEEQLSNIVPNEARKYIPVPLSEVSIDWFMIPQETLSVDNSSKDDFKKEILVVAIHNDILIKYQEILKNSNLSVDSFEMEIFSGIRSSFSSHEIAPVLLMDFGASKTKLSIVESGIVRIFHIINRGGQDITKNISSALGISFLEAEKLKRKVGLNFNSDPKVADIIKTSVDYIFSETNAVVLAYEKKYNRNISKVVVTGGGSLIDGLVEYSLSAFNIEVVRSDPFSKIEAPAYLALKLKEAGPEFSFAIGLALRKLF